MLFQNILVPYDGSKYSLHAFKIATDITKSHNSNLTVATVIPRSYYPGGWHVSAEYDEVLQDKQEKMTIQAFSKVQSIAKKRGIEIETSVLESNLVVKKLISFAKSKKIDLIVMGTHGRTGWKKLILGSVANEVVQHASCPVLLVR